MDKALEQRIIKARILQEGGYSSTQIAQELKVTSRTIRRWMNKAVAPEVEEELDEISRNHREKFVADCWRIIHKLNALIEKRVDEGDFKGRDAAIALGILSDKVTRIGPRFDTTEETSKSITFVLRPYQEEAPGKVLEEAPMEALPEAIDDP